ncbi:MAG: hypothetical protein NTZ54_03240 [Alphaproteobacteria bacterium]|nr:hypothetical protein [Alphaproteobacteria bacterium]
MRVQTITLILVIFITSASKFDTAFHLSTRQSFEAMRSAYQGFKLSLIRIVGTGDVIIVSIITSRTVSSPMIAPTERKPTNTPASKLRREELIDILSAGLQRLFSQQSSSLSTATGDSCLDFTSRQSGVRRQRYRERTGG